MPTLWWSLAALVAAPAGDGVTMLSAGFDDGLTGWEQRGPADFTLAREMRHAGTQSLRIDVPAGAELHWQQAAYLFGPVVKGDTFHVELWVRSRDLADGSGAYGALEFVDAGGGRVGIFHSAIGLGNGAAEWQRLTIDGTAPDGTARARLSLVLNGHGTAWFDEVSVVRTGRLEAWPDLGAAERSITVSDEVAIDHFAGVGFHVFDHVFPATEAELNTVILKRWREVRPSFARLNDSCTWTPAEKEQVAWWLQQFKATGTELYLATWGPKDCSTPDELATYATERAADFDWFIHTKDCTNIRWYCMTNELSLKSWGSLHNDLPRFRAYHQALHDAFAAKGLPIGLLATDASPEGWWDTIEWAAEHMDDITAIYGGHEYFNNRTPDDERFYGWFVGRLQWAVKVSRSRGKDFILGEFGCKQDGRTVDGMKLDRCVWFETPTEPLVALQLADTVIAALNAGVYALANWTFMDFPDNSRTYQNKWGMFRRGTTDHGVDFSTRPHYYAYGLLSKHFRGPSTAYRVATDDPWLRAGALVHNGADTASIVVLNRYHGDVPVTLALGRLPVARPFRRYLYDSANPPSSPFGDLQPPTGTVTAVDGALHDRIGANCLVIYTTAYEDQAPPAITGLSAENGHLTWRPSPSADLCYYRVFSGDRQIGSTIATTFDDPDAAADYHVLAVDQSGNAGP